MGPFKRFLGGVFERYPDPADWLNITDKLHAWLNPDMDGALYLRYVTGSGEGRTFRTLIIVPEAFPDIVKGLRHAIKLSQERVALGEPSFREFVQRVRHSFRDPPEHIFDSSDYVVTFRNAVHTSISLHSKSPRRTMSLNASEATELADLIEFEGALSRLVKD